MNLYQAFQALIPRASQIIAIVQAEHSDGTTSCLTLDNQAIRVRGVNGRQSGDRVFVEIDPAMGATIIGDAPELMGYEVEV